MARQKKYINYTFDDGEVQLPATYIAVCTISGEKVPIYHKNLVKIIETKYNNSFKNFVASFVSSSCKREQKEQLEEDPSRLNIYATYLIICYREALAKNDEYTTFICAERFEKHFKRDITLFINDPLVTRQDNERTL